MISFDVQATLQCEFTIITLYGRPRWAGEVGRFENHVNSVAPHNLTSGAFVGGKNFNQSCVNTARLSISCEGRSSLIASTVLSKNNRLIANEARRKINLTKATFGDCVT